MDVDISASGKLILLVALPATALLLYFLWRNRDEEDKNGDRRSVTTSRQTVIEIKIPQKAVGALIGRQGTHINEIQERTGARINLRDESRIEGDDDRTMVIRGQTEAAQNAELSIRKFIAEMPIVDTEEIYVPVKCLGRIIGHHGDAIRNICQTSNAKVYVDRTRADYREGNHLITVTGSKEQIEMAKSLIEEKVAEDEQFRAQIAVMAANRQHQPRRRKNARPEHDTQPLSQQVSVPGEIWNDTIPINMVNTADGPWPARHEKDYLEVYISAVENPGHFWVQILTSKALQLENLTEEINTFYNSSLAEDYKTGELNVGEIVVAPFHQDSSWYRARVVGFIDGKVDLFFVDYGDNYLAEQHELRNLRSDFLSLPFQAVECYLADVKPKGGEWSEEAILNFEEMTHQCKWLVVMAKTKHYTHRGENLIPCLWLVDTNGKEDVIINEELVKHGYGEWDSRYCSTNENQKKETTFNDTFLRGPSPEDEVETVRMPVEYCDWARDYTWSWAYTDPESLDQDSYGKHNQAHIEALTAAKDHDNLFSDKMRQTTNTCVSNEKSESEKDLLNRAKTEQLQTLRETMNSLHPESDVRHKDVTFHSRDIKKNESLEYSLIPRFETVDLVTDILQSDIGSSQKSSEVSCDKLMYNLSSNSGNSKLYAGIGKERIEPEREGGNVNDEKSDTEFVKKADLCVESAQRHSSVTDGQAVSLFEQAAFTCPESTHTDKDFFRVDEDGFSADDEYSSGVSEIYDPNNNPNLEADPYRENELEKQGLVGREDFLHIEEVNLPSKDAEFEWPPSTIESEPSLEWPETFAWGTGLLMPVDAGRRVSEDMSICSDDKSIPRSFSMASAATDMTEHTDNTDVEMAQTSDTLSASDVSAGTDSDEPVPEDEPLCVFEMPERTDSKLDKDDGHVVSEDSLIDTSLLTDYNTASEVDDSNLTWDSGVYEQNASLDDDQQQLYSSPVFDSDSTAVESCDGFFTSDNMSLDTDVLRCAEGDQDFWEKEAMPDTRKYMTDINDNAQCLRREYERDSALDGFAVLESNTGDIEESEPRLAEDNLIETQISESEMEPVEQIPIKFCEVVPVAEYETEKKIDMEQTETPFEKCETEQVETPFKKCETEQIETPFEKCETEPVESLFEKCKTQVDETPSDEYETEKVETPDEECETEPVETLIENCETEQVEAPFEKWESESVETPFEECETEQIETPFEKSETEPIETPFEEYETESVETAFEENEAEQVETSFKQCETETIKTPFEKCETAPVETPNENCETEQVEASFEKCDIETPFESCETNSVEEPFEECKTEPSQTPFEVYKTETVETLSEKCGTGQIETPSQELETEPVETPIEKCEPDLVTPSKYESEPDYYTDSGEPKFHEECEVQESSLQETESEVVHHTLDECLQTKESVEKNYLLDNAVGHETQLKEISDHLVDNSQVIAATDTAVSPLHLFATGLQDKDLVSETVEQEDSPQKESLLQEVCVSGERAVPKSLQESGMVLTEKMEESRIVAQDMSPDQETEMMLAEPDTQLVRTESKAVSQKMASISERVIQQTLSSPVELEESRQESIGIPLEMASASERVVQEFIPNRHLVTEEIKPESSANVHEMAAVSERVIQGDASISDMNEMIIPESGASVNRNAFVSERVIQHEATELEKVFSNAVPLTETPVSGESKECLVIAQDTTPDYEADVQDFFTESATEDTTVGHLKISQDCDEETEASVQEERQFSEVVVCHDDNINFELTMQTHEYSELPCSVLSSVIEENLLPSDNFAQETETALQKNIQMPELVSSENAALQFEVPMQALPLDSCHAVISSCQQDYLAEGVCTDEMKVLLDEIIGVVELAVNEYPDTKNEMISEQISEEHENCIVFLGANEQEHIRPDEKFESQTDIREVFLTSGAVEHDSTEIYDDYSLEQYPLEIENNLKSSHSHEYTYIRGNHPEETAVNFQEQKQEYEVSEESVDTLCQEVSSEQIPFKSESLVGFINERDHMACLQSEAKETKASLQEESDEYRLSEHNTELHSEVVEQTDTSIGPANDYEILQNKAVEMKTTLQVALEKLELAEHEVEEGEITCLQHITEGTRLSIPSVIDPNLTMDSVSTVLEGSVKAARDTDVELQQQGLNRQDLELSSQQATEADSEIRANELMSEPQNVVQDGQENVLPEGETLLSIKCLLPKTPEATVCDNNEMFLVTHTTENEEKTLIENCAAALQSESGMSAQQKKQIDDGGLHSIGDILALSVLNQILSEAPDGELSNFDDDDDIKREPTQYCTDSLEGAENEEQINFEDLSVMMPGETEMSLQQIKQSPIATRKVFDRYNTSLSHPLVCLLGSSSSSDRTDNSQDEHDVLCCPDDEMLIRTLVVEPAIRIVSETDPAIILEPMSYGSGQTKYENYCDLDMSGSLKSEMLQRYLETSIQTAQAIQSSGYYPDVATIHSETITHPEPHLLEHGISRSVTDDVAPNYLNVPQVPKSRDIFKEKTPPPVIKKPQSRASSCDSQVSKPEDIYVQPEPRHKLLKSLSRSSSVDSYSTPVSYNNPRKTWSRGASLDLDFAHPDDTGTTNIYAEQVYNGSLSQIPALEKDLDKSLSEFCKLVTSALGDMTTENFDQEESTSRGDDTEVPINRILQNERISEVESVESFPDSLDKDFENSLQSGTGRSINYLEETEISLDDEQGREKTNVDQKCPSHQSFELKNYQDVEESLHSHNEITTPGKIPLVLETDMQVDESFDKENQSLNDSFLDDKLAEGRNYDQQENWDTETKGNAKQDTWLSEEDQRIYQCEESPLQCMSNNEETSDVWANGMSDTIHSSSAVEADHHCLLAADDLFEAKFETKDTVNVIDESEPSLQPWQQITDKYYGEEHRTSSVESSSVASDDVELFIDEEKLLKDLIDSPDNSERSEVAADQTIQLSAIWDRCNKQNREISSDTDSDFMADLQPLYGMGVEKESIVSGLAKEMEREKSMLTNEQQIRENDFEIDFPPFGGIIGDRLGEIDKYENEHDISSNDFDRTDELLPLPHDLSDKSAETVEVQNESCLGVSGQHNSDNLQQKYLSRQFDDQTFEDFEDSISEGRSGGSQNDADISGSAGMSEADDMSQELIDETGVPRQVGVTNSDVTFREAGNMFNMLDEDKEGGKERDCFSDSASGVSNDSYSDYNSDEYSSRSGSSSNDEVEGANIEVGSSRKHQSDTDDDEHKHKVGEELYATSSETTSSDLAVEPGTDCEDSLRNLDDLEGTSGLDSPCESSDKAEAYCIDDKALSNDSSVGILSDIYSQDSIDVGSIDDEVFMDDPIENRWKESYAEVGRNVAVSEGIMEEQTEDVEFVSGLSEAVHDSDQSQINSHTSDSKIDEDSLTATFEAAQLQPVEIKVSGEHRDTKPGNSLIRDIELWVKDNMDSNEPVKYLSEEDETLEELRAVALQELGSCINQTNAKPANNDNNVVTLESTHADKFELQMSSENLDGYPSTEERICEIAKTTQQSNNLVDGVMEENVEMGVFVKSVSDYRALAASDVCPPAEETEDDIVVGTEESDSDRHFQDNFNEFVIGLSPVHSSCSKVYRSNESTDCIRSESCFQEDSSLHQPQLTGADKCTLFIESGIAMEQKEELSESWTTISNEDVAEMLELDDIAESRAEEILMFNGTERMQDFITEKMDKTQHLSIVEQDKKHTLITGETDKIDSLQDKNGQKPRKRKIKKSKPIKIPDPAVQEHIHSSDKLSTDTAEIRQTSMHVVSKSESLKVEETREFLPDESKQKKKKKKKKKKNISHPDDSKCENMCEAVGNECVPTIEIHKSDPSGQSMRSEQTFMNTDPITLKVNKNSSCRSDGSSDAQAGDSAILISENVKKKMKRKKKSHTNTPEERASKEVADKSVSERKLNQDVETVRPQIVEHLADAEEHSSDYPILSTDKSSLTPAVKRKKRKSKSRNRTTEGGRKDIDTPAKPQNTTSTPKPLSTDLKSENRAEAKQLETEAVRKSRLDTSAVLVVKKALEEGDVKHSKKKHTKQTHDSEIQSSIKNINNSNLVLPVLVVESVEAPDSVESQSFSINKMERTSQFLLSPHQEKIPQHKQRSRSANVFKVTESSMSAAHSHIKSGRSKSSRRFHTTDGSHPQAAFLPLGSLTPRHRRRKKNIVYVNVAPAPSGDDIQPTKRKKRPKKH